jgi:PII-like signaling protein
MNLHEVTVVRIYLTEAEHLFGELMALLHDREKVRGVTAFRGIAGFGQSGKMHSSTLIDVSLDLPLVLEFFDEPQKIERVIEHLDKRIGPGRILSWPAKINLGA